jgi:hypothetical protein
MALMKDATKNTISRCLRTTTCLVLLLGLLGCNRWRPATARTVRIGHPFTAFESARLVLEAEGYTPIETDYAAWELETPAHLDATDEPPCLHTLHVPECPKRSILVLRVLPGGDLRISARGAHVRRDRGAKPGEPSRLMHHRLSKEVDYLTLRLQRVAEKLRPMLTATLGPGEPLAGERRRERPDAADGGT